MDYRETTRWYLRRLHQTDYLIVNIGEETDISRSVRSVIELNKIHFQHISKRHCIISCQNGVATLTDETSTTGTYVNDRKFSREHPGSIILKEGDLIGIGTPCQQDESFYRTNSHVLLFQVCKDRNRIVRQGDVDMILGSDEEPEDVKVFALQQVPQQKEIAGPANPAKRDERLYRIVERIDLSSDDEAVQYLETSERVTRLDESILKETEIKSKELEEQKRQKEEEKNRQKEVQADKENRQQEEDNVEISKAKKASKEERAKSNAVDDKNRDDRQERKSSKDKDERRHREHEKTPRSHDDKKKGRHEQASSSSRRHEDHKSHHKHRDEKRERSGSSSSKGQPESHWDKSNGLHRDRQKSPDKTPVGDIKLIDDYCDNNNKATDQVIDLDEIDERFQDSYACLSPERPAAQSSASAISLDDSDEAEDEEDFSELRLTQSFYRRIKKEAQEVDTQEEDDPEPEQPIERQIKVENDSPRMSPLLLDDTPIYITDDDEDDDYLEDSKRWFQRLSQRNSPLKSKARTLEDADRFISALPSVKPIEIDEYCSRDQDIPDDILDIVLEEPEATTSLGSPERKQSSSSTTDKLNLPGIEKVPSPEISYTKTRQEERDEFLDNFYEELTQEEKQKQPDASYVSPNLKSQTSLDPPGSVPSMTVPSGSKTTLKSPDAGRTPVKEKNSNSASNAWISKKIPVIEPHHIVKRRMSVSAASLNKKPPKLAKHSPVRQAPPDLTKEARKQKLKEITAKKNQSNDGDSKNSKALTKPKVKFTPSNRGAFLTEQVPGPSKPPIRQQSSSLGNAIDDDFICTQSTSLTNVPSIDNMIDIEVRKAPKLTFNSVAKVSRVAQNAPAFKIPLRKTSVTQKPSSTTTHGDSILSILDNIHLPPTSNPVAKLLPLNNNHKPEPLPAAVFSPIRQGPSRMKSILRSPLGLTRKMTQNRVKWKESLTETRTFEIDDGNYMTVQTRMYKDNNDFFRDMSQESCQNDIIQNITSWNADWFDNPMDAKISGEKLLPMVEEYADFEAYKQIVLPILKTELFHDILGQYVEVKKRAQQPIQMKVNQIRSQGRTFVLNCSVESNQKQTINNKDYVLILFRDKGNGNDVRFPAVVTGRRQQIQYSEENGIKFFHCTIETAKTPIAQRMRDGHGENYRILSLTQINLHMRQFHVLFNLQDSPLLENILSPRSNFYSVGGQIDRHSYKGKEALNVQQGDILLSVFGQCLDISRPHIMLIQGPPGTGKSRLISNLVLQLRRGIPERRLKILVCAQSNTAVDVIVLKLMKLLRLLNKDERCNMLRTGASTKVNPECRIVFLDDLARKHVNEQIKCRKLRDEDPMFETYYLQKETLDKRIKYLRSTIPYGGGSLLQSSRLQDEIDQLQSQFDKIKGLLPGNVDEIDLHDKDRRNMEMHAKKQFVAKADVICTTLGSCGGLTDYIQSLKFDVCIIDEATQCTEIASFTPLQFDVKKLILVGDVKQLPPLVFGKECAEAGLKNSLFSRIQNSFIGTSLEGVKMLTTQYRMHPEILKWPNEFFYDGKLTSDPRATKCDGFPFKPYTVFSLECQQNQTQMEHQIYNNEEIHFVLKLLTEIMQYCDRHTSIAIITPYTRHKRECEKFLHAKSITQVSVLSIDSVQGQEYDVVIISLARTIGTGFLGNPQRLNVALTRARKCLVMCGNFYDLRDANVWSELLKDAEERQLLYHIEDDDEYDDADTFVEKVMRHLRKNPTADAIV
ncbi:uncharacterized protein Setx isoform X2 [Ochlerotatus camptorhynchus]|uniref:uncharacterized protein Setx isoform X2 n=1 Tax=Ochlerotatus camptorhynchus TaxID=644619 RepID=UPI0031D06077